MYQQSAFRKAQNLIADLYLLDRLIMYLTALNVQLTALSNNAEFLAEEPVNILDRGMPGKTLSPPKVQALHARGVSSAFNTDKVA